MVPSAREEPSRYQGEGFEITQKGETNSGPREWESAVECLVGVGARVLGVGHWRNEGQVESLQ
jgi:hypothetical protein